jgi:hypothetical protein
MYSFKQGFGFQSKYIFIYPFFAMLRTEPRALHMVSEAVSLEPRPQNKYILKHTLAVKKIGREEKPRA